MKQLLSNVIGGALTITAAIVILPIIAWMMLLEWLEI